MIPNWSETVLTSKRNMLFSRLIWDMYNQHPLIAICARCWMQFPEIPVPLQVCKSYHFIFTHELNSGRVTVLIIFLFR